MYSMINFRTKKELKAAVAAGRKVAVFQPGPFGGTPVPDGKVCIEGPHYPEPHRWYASALVKDGIVVKITG